MAWDVSRPQLSNAARRAGAALSTGAQVASDPTERQRWRDRCARRRQPVSGTVHPGQLRAERPALAAGQSGGNAGGLADQDQSTCPAATSVPLRHRPHHRFRRHPASGPGLPAATASLRRGGLGPDTRPAALRGVLPHSDRPVDLERRAAECRLPHPDVIRSALPRTAFSSPTRRAPVNKPNGRRSRALQAVLAEPLEDCLAVDARGVPCVEVMSPLDMEAELRMPGGHIFHGELSWPWLADDATVSSAAERWGVSTDYPGILLCGSGSRPRWCRQRSGWPQCGDGRPGGLTEPPGGDPLLCAWQRGSSAAVGSAGTAVVPAPGRRRHLRCQGGVCSFSSAVRLC